MVNFILTSDYVISVFILWLALSQFISCDTNNTSASNGTEMLDNSLLSWDAPPVFRKTFPYYLIGYDKEDSPVFLVEFGRWDMRTFLESGMEEAKFFDKYLEQLAVRVTRTELIPPVDPEHPPHKFIVIADLEGYELRQVISPPSINAYLKGMRAFVSELRKKNINIKKGFFINSTFVFQSVWNLLKPIFGETFSFMELFGTKTTVWKRALLEYIPKEQLPEIYGGTKDHKPLVAYG